MDATAGVSIGATGNFNPARAKKMIRSRAGEALFRLRANEGFKAGARALIVTSWLLMFAILADRLLSLKEAGYNVYIICGALSALSLPYVIWRICAPKLNETSAAVLADERLNLNSRLSSALTIDFNSPENSEFGAEFLHEALHRAQAADIKGAFPLRVPKSVAWSAPAIIAAVLIAVFVPYQDRLGLLTKAKAARKAHEATVKAGTALAKSIERYKKDNVENKDEGTPHSKVTEVAKNADELAKQMQSGQRNREEAMAELAKMKKQIQDEREKLLRGKEFTDRMEKLKAKDLNLDDDAFTKDVSSSLKDADPQQAARNMRKLANKIKQEILDNDQLTPEQKQQKLQQLQKEVERLAGALADDETLSKGLRDLSKEAMSAAEYASLQDEIKKQTDRQKNSGKDNGGDKMSQQIEQIADELERLGDDNDANLSDADKEEEKDLDEAEEGLDAAIEGLGDEQAGKPGQDGKKSGGQKAGKVASKKGSSGKKGKSSSSGAKGADMNGQTAEANGGGNKPGGKNGQSSESNSDGSQKNGDKNGKPGKGGGGGGPGQGRRPYRDGDAEFEQQKVRGQMQAGAITGLSHFRGQGVKGEAPVEYVKTMEAAEHEAQSSLEMDRIPADAREVVKDYFLKMKDNK